MIWSVKRVVYLLLTVALCEGTKSCFVVVAV